MKRSVVAVALAALALGGCQQRREYTIALLAPLTGEYAIYGEPVRRGVELAYEHIQKDGNLPFPLHLEVVDSRSDVEVAKQELDRLYAEGVIGVIGGIVSSEALELVQVADKYDRVLLSPSASVPELTGISKNFYRVFPSDFLEGTKLGNFAAQKANVRSLVILALENPYAKGVQEVFEAEFVRNGGKVLEDLEFPAQLRDFSDLVDHAISLKPDGVFVAAFAREIADMIKLFRRKGYKGTLFTTSAFATEEGLKIAGKAANGVYLSQTVFDVDSDNPTVKEFVESYRAKYEGDPNIYSAHGYDALGVMVQGLLQPEMRLDTDYWRALRGIREFPGVTGPLQFDERGDVRKYPRVYIVKDGALFDYENEVEMRRRELQERLNKLREEQRRRLLRGKS